MKSQRQTVAMAVVTSVIGALLIGAFLLYYIAAVRSVPLSVIMIAILLMVVRTIYDELTQRNNNRKADS